MSLGTKAGLGPDRTVLHDGDPAPRPKRGTVPPILGHAYCGQTVAHLSCCGTLVYIYLHVKRRPSADSRDDDDAV